MCGGTSTYVLQLAKRYKDRDIAVIYKTMQPKMIRKIQNYCRCYQLHPDDRIKCKVMIINYDSSVCDQVDEGKIYMTLHADYSNEIYGGGHPDFRDRIDGYISITKHIQSWLKDKCNIESQLIYNPLTIEDNKPIILMSATRMSKAKGRERTIKLAEALNKRGVNYIWLCFTPNTDEIDNPNVIYMKARTDFERFIRTSNLSAFNYRIASGLSYTINEFLYRNIPVITTKLPYLDEIGFKDGETGYTVEFDCSNVDEVAEKITNVPKFKFKHLNDSYDDIFTNKKSHYAEDMKKMVEIQCIYPMGFYDIDVEAWRKQNEVWQVNLIRARELLEHPKKIVKLVEEG